MQRLKSRSSLLATRLWANKLTVSGCPKALKLAGNTISGKRSSNRATFFIGTFTVAISIFLKVYEAPKGTGYGKEGDNAGNLVRPGCRCPRFGGDRCLFAAVANNTIPVACGFRVCPVIPACALLACFAPSFWAFDHKLGKVWRHKSPRQSHGGWCDGCNATSVGAFGGTYMGNGCAGCRPGRGRNIRCNTTRSWQQPAQIGIRAGG